MKLWSYNIWRFTFYGPRCIRSRPKNSMPRSFRRSFCHFPVHHFPPLKSGGLLSLSHFPPLDLSGHAWFSGPAFSVGLNPNSITSICCGLNCLNEFLLGRCVVRFPRYSCGGLDWLPPSVLTNFIRHTAGNKNHGSTIQNRTKQKTVKDRKTDIAHKTPAQTKMNIDYHQ